MKELRDIDVMDLIVPQLVDRAGRIYIDDNEYLQAFEKQEDVFKKLNNVLTKKQAKTLERYLEHVYRTGEIIERMVYIQGMKDMFSIICKLQGKNNVEKRRD